MQACRLLQGSADLAPQGTVADPALWLLMLPQSAPSSVHSLRFTGPLGTVQVS